LAEQQKPLHRRRHAVLIELGGSEAVQPTAADVFDRVTVTDAVGALEAITDEPGVSVVIVDDTAGTGAGAILDEVGEAEPSLPIVLVSKQADERARVTLPPDVDGKSLRHAMSDLAEVQTYSPSLVDAFIDAAVGSLSDGFVKGAQVTGAFYKANRRHLAEVNALLHFEGGAFSGWVIIASSQETLAAIYASMFGGAEASKQDLEDLAGEISNHVVARLRRWLPDSRPRIVSVPEILRGEGELMRKTRARHSLTLEITTDHAPMFAQLHFATDVPIEIAGEPTQHEAFQMF
jgi:CheY-specific phosphatase CheX